MRPNTAAVAAILVVGSVFVGLSAIFTVGEGERALVVRLGAPVAATDTPGLRFKIPFVDTVTVYDARLLALDPPAEQIILGDQKRIEAQTYTRFRITDTLLFNQSLRTVEQARAQQIGRAHV